MRCDMKAKKITELALLSTIALTIFIVELRIPDPIPIPGVKLGLANIITVYAVYRYSPKETFLIILTRILLGAFFSGNAMSLLYSIVGGLFCFAGMLVLHRLLPQKWIWLCSVFGAIFHNIGQIIVAVIIAGFGMLSFLPFLLFSGCLAGAFTGGCTQLILNRNFLRKVEG